MLAHALYYSNQRSVALLSFVSSISYMSVRMYCMRRNYCCRLLSSQDLLSHALLISLDYYGILAVVVSLRSCHHRTPAFSVVYICACWLLKRHICNITSSFPLHRSIMQFSRSRVQCPHLDKRRTHGLMSQCLGYPPENPWEATTSSVTSGSFRSDIANFCRRAVVVVRVHTYFYTREVFCWIKILLEVALNQPVCY